MVEEEEHVQDLSCPTYVVNIFESALFTICIICVGRNIGGNFGAVSFYEECAYIGTDERPESENEG